MKIPQRPPTLASILTETPAPRLMTILTSLVSPSPAGKYYHWDVLRHVPPPEGFSAQEAWAGAKFARSQNRREIPLLDQVGRHFSYITPDPVLERLHEIDRNASGLIAAPESITNPHTRDRYLQSSLIEEAITSSQLEGAATTREQAKEMIRLGRKPIDRSERMILNNYRAMQYIGQFRENPLTPELVMSMHEIITDGTMSDEYRPPYLRQPGDDIAVWDDRDNTRLHTPPAASEIPARMQAMCDFANGAATGAFLHPVVKAILLHFWLAYDHPFCDGNGRTARALFYWSMLSQGYWLIEFISISSVLRKAPARYSRSFLYVETDENDLTYFIDEQLRVVRRAIDELRGFLARKMEEVQKIEGLLRAYGELNHRQLAFLNHAARHPGSRYTIKSHQKSHGVTYETARTDLLGLGKKGLVLCTRQKNTFVFTALPDLYEKLRTLSREP